MDEKELEQLLREIVAERNARSDKNGWGVKFGVVRDLSWRRTCIVVRKGVTIGVVPILDSAVYAIPDTYKDMVVEAISAALHALNEPDLLHDALAEQFKLASMLR